MAVALTVIGAGMLISGMVLFVTEGLFVCLFRPRGIRMGEWSDRRSEPSSDRTSAPVNIPVSHPPARFARDDGHAGSFLLWPPGTHSRYLLFADSVVAASESGRRLRELGGRADFLVS